MNGWIKGLSFSMALALTVSAGLISCGGGDGDGGQDGGDTTTINGRVADVMTATAPSGKRTSMLALIKDFLSLSKNANAQASGVSGITVELMVDGETVDTDITDGGGNFTLSLTSSATTNITLVFITDEFSVSIEITIPPGAIINIVVTLNPDEVIVNEMEVVEGTIRCETGFVDISELGADIVIDGGGVDDCIRVEGNCVLNIQSDSLTLTNCQRCIDGGGTAELNITSGDIACEAEEDGIRSRGNSVITLESDTDISIIGGQNGIRAEGNSVTSLSAAGKIDISGNENGIRAEGTSTVDVNALGECTIFGSENPIREDGVPIVDVGNCLLIGP